MRLGAMNPDEPFSGTTVPVTISPNSERVTSVIKTSRTTYAMKYIEPINNQIKTKKLKEKPTQRRVSHAILP